VARDKIGWCFWELMIGSTQFSQGRRPYQGHIYPDGTCYSVNEVAAILHPGGDDVSSAEVAAMAGFKVSDKSAKGFTEEGVVFSPLWEKWTGTGPAGNRLWYANDAGETATKDVEGRSVVLVMKHGPDCGIASVAIDGKPAGKGEIDTYNAEVDWNRQTVVAENREAGRHKVVITVTGRKAAASSNSFVQVVDIIGK